MCIKHFIVYRQTNAYILCESNRIECVKTTKKNENTETEKETSNWSDIVNTRNIYNLFLFVLLLCHFIYTHLAIKKMIVTNE